MLNKKYFFINFLVHTLHEGKSCTFNLPNFHLFSNVP